MEVEKVKDVLSAFQERLLLRVQLVQSTSLRFKQQTHDKGENERVHVWVLVEGSFSPFLEVEIALVLKRRMVVQIGEVLAGRALLASVVLVVLRGHRNAWLLLDHLLQ